MGLRKAGIVILTPVSRDDTCGRICDGLARAAEVKKRGTPRLFCFLGFARAALERPLACATGLPTVNISVGYYEPHSPLEHFSLPQLRRGDEVGGGGTGVPSLIVRGHLSCKRGEAL